MESLIQPEKEEKFNLRQIIQVLKDIKSLTQSYPDLKISVKKDYSEIKISQDLDVKLYLELAFKDNFWVLNSHGLPDRVPLLRTGMSTTLKRAVENCKVAIENLTDFYEVLETIDKKSQVLEPKQPTSKHNWRIIRYFKNLYVKIELPNPMNIKDVCVTFFGKSFLVEKFTSLYNAQETEEENIYWRLHYLKYELEEEEDMDDGEKLDCGICLDFYNEQNQCPLIFCENPLCTQVFHSDCLSLHLKVSNVKVLNVVVGECPYCKFKIQANFIKDEQNNNVEKNESDVEMETL